mmetsp:Transcript_9175/g.12755  ORF Transcript_9175/g.12755 Transcript_9175/m.12755 type:complete len:410 (-) Transcript_9175:542-1771(-)
MLEHCTEACGWAAALVSIFAWGSFGVPVKGKTCSRLNVDPLVMQTYKTSWCFLTSWLVIPVLGVQAKFTYWGIISGLFWVPGATAGIYGIQNAGLAIAVGTWSALVVLSSFFWGVFVFHEGVKSFPRACSAVLLLCVGLVGMAQYSQPKKKIDAYNDVGNGNKNDEKIKRGTNMSDYEGDGGSSDEEGATRKRADKVAEISSLEIEPLVSDENEMNDDEVYKEKKDNTTWTFRIGKRRLKFTKRQMGIICAAINGAWGGTCMIPLHYAREEGFGGPGYVISFASGSMIVTVWIWALRYLYILDRLNFEFKEAYEIMPSFYLREMWMQGSLAGILYSIGNFGSIISVTMLGQGVGYSCTQLSLLVSGLWGIFYFGEIKGGETIFGWLSAASLTIAGIIWLSHEHVGEEGH